MKVLQFGVFPYQVKLLLQFLVRVINTELFETVDFERLKSVYIQNPDKPMLFAAGFQSSINRLYDPAK